MDFVIKLSSLSLPLILLLFAMLLFFSKEDYMESFAVGAKDGMINCINLFPTLLLFDYRMLPFIDFIQIRSAFLCTLF